MKVRVKVRQLIVKYDNVEVISLKNIMIGIDWYNNIMIGIIINSIMIGIYLV